MPAAKGSVRISSTPNCRSTSALAAGSCITRVGAAGRSTTLGCGQKVSTPGVPPAVRAASTARRMTS
jgi:hypothetical protein